MKPRASDQRTATLGGRAVAYTVTVSPRAATARIRVGPAGVEVIVPAATPGRAAEFLAENAGWVLRQLERVDRLGSVDRPGPAPSPGTILLGGERVPLRVVQVGTNRRYPDVVRVEDGLEVRTPAGLRAGLAAAVERWLRRYARAVIEARVGVRAQVVGRSPNRVYIRGQRTKWGNCSAGRNLSFNWRLVMAPAAVLDAIVTHELAHLVEPSHGPRFWLVVRSHCPDYARHARWLDDHAAALFAPIPVPPPGG